VKLSKASWRRRSPSCICRESGRAVRKDSVCTTTNVFASLALSRVPGIRRLNAFYDRRSEGAKQSMRLFQQIPLQAFIEPGYIIIIGDIDRFESLL